MQPQHTISKMLSKLKLQWMQHKLLLLTSLGSLVLHIVFLTEFSINLPQLFENKQTLEMRLVQQQPKPISKATPDKIIKEDKKPKAPEQEPEPAPVLEPVATETINPEVISAAEAPVTPSANSSETIPEAGGSSGDGDEIAAANLPEANEEKTPKKIVYSHVETEFEVIRGINTSAAGATRIVFKIDADGHYSIISTTQAKGLVSLFFGTLTQKSEGTVTENGLKPDFYSYQYGNDAKKSQTANFAWDDNLVHMHSSKGDTTANLVAGTQDFLSFMYQFMFVPPLDSMQITMTNGKRLRSYSYSFEGEETITTKLGELKTIHLLKGSSDEDKTEIWLATDYQYLPVKIRKTEKDGTVIEQIAANIRTEIPN